MFRTGGMLSTGKQWLRDISRIRLWKSFKALITAIAFGIVASAPLAQAQQKKGQMTAEQQIENIEQAVGSLTKDQKAKIADIIAKTREEMQGVPKEERKDKMTGAMKKQHDAIRALLTDEQKPKYDAMAPAGGKGGGKKKNQ